MKPKIELPQIFHLNKNILSTVELQFWNRSLEHFVWQESWKVEKASEVLWVRNCQVQGVGEWAFFPKALDSCLGFSPMIMRPYLLPLTKALSLP